MSDCGQFFLGSRRRTICDGQSELPIETVNQFREMWGMNPLTLGEDGETYTTSSTGVAIKIIPRDPSATRPSAGCCGGGGTPRDATRGPSVAQRVVKFVDAAARHAADGFAMSLPIIAERRREICGACPNNVDGQCQVCKCYLEPGLLHPGKIGWRSESCPVGKWARHSDSYRPFTGPIKRTLIFHLYPRLGAEWNWHKHIQHIRDSAHHFDRIVIGIAHDAGTAHLEVVQALFSGIPVTDWVVRSNEAMPGETVTFIDMLSLIQTDDPNAVCLYGHTKGVKHPQDSVMQLWAEAMWQTCLDLPSVDDALESHVFAGSFKRDHKLHDSAWHYSGTFFWFRSAEIFKRNWRAIYRSYAGTEGWPGAIASSEEAACLFHDNCGPLYERKIPYWESHVEPELAAWKLARVIS